MLAAALLPSSVVAQEISLKELVGSCYAGRREVRPREIPGAARRRCPDERPSNL